MLHVIVLTLCLGVDVITSDLEARQALVLRTSKTIDAELDVNIVRESNQIGILGSEEFINEVCETKTSKLTLK